MILDYTRNIKKNIGIITELMYCTSLQENKSCGKHSSSIQWEKKNHIFEAEIVNTCKLGDWKILTSQSHNTSQNIQINTGGERKSTRLKEIRILPAEILLISQMRSPSLSPPKAKTKGKSGQQAAQKRTPWKV